MIFAESDSSSVASIWALLATITTAVTGIIAVYIKQQKEVQLKKLEINSKDKEKEAEARAIEVASLKKSMNDLYSKWKDIAEMYRTEKDALQKRLEEKSAECIAMQIQFKECRKQLDGRGGISGGPDGPQESRIIVG